MINHVECLTEVNAQETSTHGWLLGVETPDYFGSQRQKSGDGGMTLLEAVLGWRSNKSRLENAQI